MSFKSPRGHQRDETPDQFRNDVEHATTSRWGEGLRSAMRLLHRFPSPHHTGSIVRTHADRLDYEFPSNTWKLVVDKVASNGRLGAVVGWHNPSERGLNSGIILCTSSIGLDNAIHSLSAPSVPMLMIGFARAHTRRDVGVSGPQPRAGQPRHPPCLRAGRSIRLKTAAQARTASTHHSVDPPQRCMLGS